MRTQGKLLSQDWTTDRWCRVSQFSGAETQEQKPGLSRKTWMVFEELLQAQCKQSCGESHNTVRFTSKRLTRYLQELSETNLLVLLGWKGRRSHFEIHGSTLVPNKAWPQGTLVSQSLTCLDIIRALLSWEMEIPTPVGPVLPHGKRETPKSSPFDCSALLNGRDKKWETHVEVTAQGHRLTTTLPLNHRIIEHCPSPHLLSTLVKAYSPQFLSPSTPCLSKRKLQGIIKGKKPQFEETEQVSDVQCGRDVGIITWALKTAMINRVRSLIHKEDILQAQKGDVSREMKVLRKSHFG